MSSGGIIAITVDEGDEVIAVRLTAGDQEIFLASSGGKAIRFAESDVRPMGRTSRGVRGMTLKGGDQLVAMEVPSPGSTILTVTENGFGKRTPLEEYPGQNRGGQGVITIKTSKRNGMVAGAMQVASDDHLMLSTEGGKIIRMAVADISTVGRNTQGVRLVELDDDLVSGVMRLAEPDDEEPGEGE